MCYYDKNQMKSDNSMDEPLVPTPQPKISKSKKFLKKKKPTEPLEPLKRLVIESGIFVLTFD
jgi:hypothetical protein